MKKYFFVGVLFLTCTRASAQSSDRFELAVACIKQFEGWHTAMHYPYVGYGHKLLKEDTLTADLTETQADSLLRRDLRQKCAVFRRFGKDSLLLGVLAYNVGEYTLLGSSARPQSKLVRKLSSGDRDIYAEYISFRKYKGRVLPSLERRRKTEFQLLYIAQ